MDSTLVALISFFLISHLTLNSAKQSNHSLNCPPFNCGTLGKVGFPFSNSTNPECGISIVSCTRNINKVQFQTDGYWYNVSAIDYEESLILLDDDKLLDCAALDHFSIPISHFLSLKMNNTFDSFLKCNRTNSSMERPGILSRKNNYFNGCNDYEVYYNKTLLSQSTMERYNCSIIRLPAKGLATWGYDESTYPWGSKFVLQWKVLPLCDKCHDKGGFCEYINLTVQCNGWTEVGKTRMRRSKKKGIAIGVGTGVAVTLFAFVFFLALLHRRKCLSKFSALTSRSSSPIASLKPNFEKGSNYFQTPIFTYSELQEATDNFDSSKVLGGGGFGTVYYGKLRDGRVVAVKRLYENNYKRVEKFMNEITILSRLHHQNLVTLCGCTSCHSHELLLVYEYVPNGTVAYHLHGEHTTTSPLTWLDRMRIAIETADALAYLHASDTIHRDVKTNNILLDNDFHVKVADFGLSCLFRSDEKHISTAPLGTPGYVDPEYYHCYQLNDKSDVYSFGVVLIELISSKPAVDISRDRYEINLSNMAINKIHNDALHELIDPSLGYESDHIVRRMITMVAEVAFRCLQQEKDMRPSMWEVLQFLKEIKGEELKVDKAE